jgi:hypothetical protein
MRKTVYRTCLMYSFTPSPLSLWCLPSFIFRPSLELRLGGQPSGRPKNPAAKFGPAVSNSCARSSTNVHVTGRHHCPVHGFRLPSRGSSLDRSNHFAVRTSVDDKGSTR